MQHNKNNDNPQSCFTSHCYHVKLVLTMPAYTEYPLYKLTCAHTRTSQATHTLHRFGGNKTHELNSAEK